MTQLFTVEQLAAGVRELLAGNYALLKETQPDAGLLSWLSHANAAALLALEQAEASGELAELAQTFSSFALGALWAILRPQIRDLSASDSDTKLVEQIVLSLFSGGQLFTLPDANEGAAKVEKSPISEVVAPPEFAIVLPAPGGFRPPDDSMRKAKLTQLLEMDEITKDEFRVLISIGNLIKSFYALGKKKILTFSIMEKLQIDQISLIDPNTDLFNLLSRKKVAQLLSEWNVSLENLDQLSQAAV